MRLSEIMDRINTGAHQSLSESVLVPEVDVALKDWINNADGDWMLIGGLVVGYYTRPRTTTDVDVIFPSEQSIPQTVNGFKKNRGHSFQHNQTHVEVEVLSPEYLKLDRTLYDQVYATSEIKDGVRVPSPAGLVCLKLSRSSPQDLADIHAIIQKHPTLTIAGFSVPDEVTQKAELKLDIKIPR